MDPHPRLGAGEMADWVDGGSALFSPDRPEIAEHFAIQGARILEPNPGKWRRQLGTFLANPTVAWKWVQKLWILILA